MEGDIISKVNNEDVSLATSGYVNRVVSEGGDNITLEVIR